MPKFNPQETTICDDSNTPWINNRIKKLIYERNTFYKDYRKNNYNESFEK